jgi:hypothetical protein
MFSERVFFASHQARQGGAQLFSEGQPGRAQARRHGDDRAQDPGGLRPLPYREPGRPPGGGPTARGHISGHTGAFSLDARPGTP